MTLASVPPGEHVPDDINMLVEIPAHSDPVDVLVVTPHLLISASVIRCRPPGMLRMTDESGEDAKVLAVPTDKLTAIYRNVDTVRDMATALLDQIAHFFDHYKDLEPGKWVRIDGWVGVGEAHKGILDSVRRYQEAPQKPAF